MFSIGEFSRVTGLTVKSLRFYHEQGILTPSYVDPSSGYRFYGEAKIDSARVIAALRELGFTIAEITEIVGNCDDDEGILPYLEERKQDLQQRMREDRQIVSTLSDIIEKEKEARTMVNDSEFTVEQKQVDPLRIAGIRMKGKYSDCGKGFAKLGRRFGRHLCGKPMLLCYDSEYRENDADFEAAFPVRRGESTQEINVRELPGGRCVSVMHRGPYDDMSRSYELILKHVKEQGLDTDCPSREIYHKGPGMIFRGNPKKYLTEIQFMIKE